MSEPSDAVRQSAAVRGLWVAALALIVVPAAALAIATGIQMTTQWNGREPLDEVVAQYVFAVAPSALTGGFVALALALALRALPKGTARSDDEADRRDEVADDPVVMTPPVAWGRAAPHPVDERAAPGGAATAHPDLDLFRRPSSGG